jgi:hypothetical protein
LIEKDKIGNVSIQKLYVFLKDSKFFETFFVPYTRATHTNLEDFCNYIHLSVNTISKFKTAIIEHDRELGIGTINLLRIRKNDSNLNYTTFLQFKFNTMLDEGNFKVKIVNGINNLSDIENKALYISEEEITSENFEEIYLKLAFLNFSKSIPEIEKLPNKSDELLHPIENRNEILNFHESEVLKLL